jgi:hypothetical protein
MKSSLVVVITLVSLTAAPLSAQQPHNSFRIGAHVAANMMNGPFDMYRLGGQLVMPVGPRLSIYPSISRFLRDGEGEWEVSAALRYRPFGAREGSSPLYLGLGVAAINFGRNSSGYDAWITGLELPSGRLRPYVELQFLGPVHRLVESSADWGVQAHSGLTWAVR